MPASPESDDSAATTPTVWTDTTHRRFSAHNVYGLDIETDTSVDGLDPRVSAIVAVAVSTGDTDHVFDGDERRLLVELDEFLRFLDPGVLVTWYGSGFDLPFLETRSTLTGVPLGLSVGPCRHDPEALAGTWHGHRHLDAYRVYRNDLTRLLDLSCSLKSVSRLLGYEPIEVEVEQLHDLSPAELRAYVASDARLTRAAALRRWRTATPFVDQLVA